MSIAPSAAGAIPQLIPLSYLPDYDDIGKRKGGEKQRVKAKSTLEPSTAPRKRDRKDFHLAERAGRERRGKKEEGER